jgi:tRNA threonylcarbamoyladenosine biosynthesis protein TsaB
MHMPLRILILETSDRAGQVAVAAGSELLALRHLEEARRHARDLAPAVQELLREQGWQARELDAVIVSRGPGSYTGLRVGIISAKTLAYATGCALIGVDTFAAIALAADGSYRFLDVLADAQQDKVYVQSYEHTATGWEARGPLSIRPFTAWVAARAADAAVTGPGLRKWAGHVPPGVPVVDRARWEPQAAHVLTIGLSRLAGGERDDLYAIEPLYLRPSSAEEQWFERGVSTP